MHSRDMEGKFFSERQKAFGFMVDHAKLSINSMMDKVEIKEQLQKESKKKTSKGGLDKKHDVEIIENKIHLFNELDTIIMNM